VQVLTALLAVVVALTGADRPALVALVVLYTWSWAMSMLDTYQHHYFLSLVLLCLACFPPVRTADVPVASRSGPGTCAWGYVLLGVTTALVYGFAALAKLDGEWRGGHTLRRLAGADVLAGALQPVLGLPPGAVWRALAIGTIGVELAIAVGYLVAVRQDARRGRLTSLCCWTAWGLALALHVSFEVMELQIGWFSLYMVLLASVFLLPERWVIRAGAPVVVLARGLDRLLAEPGGDAPQGAGRWAWVLAALAVAALLGTAGGAIDLPGALAALLGAGALLVGSAVRALLAGTPARVRPRVVATAVAALVVWAAVTLGDARFEFHRATGEDLQTRNQPAAAVAAYLRAEPHLPRDPTTRHLFWNDLGVLLHAEGRIDEAIERYRRALAIRPDATATRENLRAALGAAAATPGGATSAF
jgi:hypothetical protein